MTTTTSRTWRGRSRKRREMGKWGERTRKGEGEEEGGRRGGGQGQGEEEEEASLFCHYRQLSYLSLFTTPGYFVTVQPPNHHTFLSSLQPLFCHYKQLSLLRLFSATPGYCCVTINSCPTTLSFSKTPEYSVNICILHTSILLFQLLFPWKIWLLYPSKACYPAFSNY